MRGSRLGAVARTLLALFATVSAVRADAPNQDVAQLIDEGLALRTEGRDAEALERFEAAYQVSQAPRVLAQIALAEQALGRWSPAHVHLLAALKRDDDPWIAQWRTELEGALQRIDSEFGALEITSTPPGATVFVGARAVGVTPLARPLQAFPGMHAVSVRLSGYQTVEQRVAVEKGKASRVEATLLRSGASVQLQHDPAEPQQSMLEGVPRVAPTTRAERHDGRSEWRRRAILLTGLSTGVALVIAGGVVYQASGSETKSLKADCYGVFTSTCDGDKRTRLQAKIKRLDNVSRALFAIGGADLLTTGIWYLVSSLASKDSVAARMKLGTSVDRASAVLYGTVEF